MRKTEEANHDRSFSIALPKLLAGLVSLAVIGIVLAPLQRNWSDEPKDDFPLSHYPMFAKQRGKRTSISHVVGFDKQGNAYRIRYKLVGTGGMNQVRKQIRRQLAEGKANELCRKVAKKIARKKSPSLEKISTVAVVTRTFELNDYVLGERRHSTQSFEASCRVK